MVVFIVHRLIAHYTYDYAVRINVKQSIGHYLVEIQVSSEQWCSLDSPE